MTRYCRGVVTKQIIDDLRDVFASVCADFEAELVELNGEDDHVHLLVNYPPKVAVSALVNSLKGVSSRMIRKKNYQSIRKKLWGDALWSPSYFAGSLGGAPIEILRQYIEQQKLHTAKKQPMTATPSTLSFPALVGRGLPRFWSKNSTVSRHPLEKAGHPQRRKGVSRVSRSAWKQFGSFTR